jgi:hypothetical protein
MKRILIASFLAALLGSVLTWGFGGLVAERTTLTRLSPDETLRASLVEREFPSIDRNFQIRLENLVKGETTTIFRSPDEGRPYGTERLIWSKDGKWLLLVGRHCFVKDDLFLDNGDQLYFLYQVPSGKFWLNSAERPDLPALKAEMVEGVEFTEPVTLKARRSN